MPGLGMSMGMSMSLRQQQEQRQILAMRQVQTLELKQLQIAARHSDLFRPGIEDPERVKVLTIPTAGRAPLTAAVKTVDHDALDPYAEVLALSEFAKRGFAAPEVIGVAEDEGARFIFTRFEKGAVNCATLMIDGVKLLPRYLKERRVRLSAELFDAMLTSLSDGDRLTLVKDLCRALRAGKQPQSGSVSAIEEQPDAGAAAAAMRRLLVSGQAPPLHACSKEFLQQHLFPVLTRRIAETIGCEAARLHQAGVYKEDLTPRNLLVFIKRNGEVSLMHTGFRSVRFETGPLAQPLCKHQLQAIEAEFACIEPTLACECRLDFAVGYVRTRFGAILNGPARAAPRKLPPLESRIDSQPDENDLAQPHYAQISLRSEMEKAVLEMPLQRLSQRAVLECWYELVADALSLEGVAFEERRGYRALVKLYKMMCSRPKVNFGDLLSCGDAELVMHPATASRDTAVARARFDIPSPAEARSLLLRSLVLRFWRESPISADGASLTAAVVERTDAGWQPSRRIVEKHYRELRATGRIANLDSSAARRVAEYIEQRLAGGQSLDLKDCAAVLNLGALEVAPLWEPLKRQHLARMAAVEHPGGHSLQAALLAEQLDLPLKEALAAIEGLVQATAREQTEPTTAGEAPSENGLLDVELEQEGEPDAAAEGLILALIEADPSVSEAQIAARLGPQWNVQRTTDFASEIYRHRGLSDRCEEVLGLIRQHPGIGDEGLCRETGLSVLDIHLIVRQDLLSGSLRKNL